jgi:hypothetical protein
MPVRKTEDVTNNAWEAITASKKNQLSSTNSYVQRFCVKILLSHASSKKTSYIYITFNSYAWLHIHSQSPSFQIGLNNYFKTLTSLNKIPLSP